MRALAVSAEQAQDFHRPITGGSEPVRDLGVELGDFARAHGDVVVGEDQPQLAAQDVQPLVALVGAKIRFAGFRRDHHLPRMHAARLLRQRHDGATATLLWSQPDPRIPDLGGVHELVEGDAMGVPGGESQ